MKSNFIKEVKDDIILVLLKFIKFDFRDNEI